jgi:hypothetical protein
VLWRCFANHPVGVESRHTRMQTWGKAVLRTIGVLDAALSFCGFYFIYMSVWGGVFALSSNADTPYFRTVFAAMTATNFGFLTLFLLSGFRLLRLESSGAIMHAIRPINRDPLGYTRTRGNERGSRNGRWEYGNCSVSVFQSSALLISDSFYCSAFPRTSESGRALSLVWSRSVSVVNRP